MTVRRILTWPDEGLSRVCAHVDEVTPEISRLANDLLETMYAAPGRGLAAPQVGALVRMFVFDATWKQGTPDPMVCINPQIVTQSDVRTTGAEGCLSLPGVTVDVTRPAQVGLAWTDVDGVRHTQEMTGFAALCVQHELDHLDGLMTLDRVDAAHRAKIIAAYEGIS